MPPDDKRLRFYEAKRIFGKSVIHQVALVFAILFIVSVVGNVVALHRFETARRHHVSQVQSWLHRLYGELHLAASREFPYDPTMRGQHDIVRNIHWSQTRGVVEALDVAVWGLAAHHNYKYRSPSAQFTLIMPVQSIFREQEDPTIHLQILADKIYALLENLELTWEHERIHDPQMPTQVLFDAIHETFHEIDSLFGWGGSLWRR